MGANGTNREAYVTCHAVKLQSAAVDVADQRFPNSLCSGHAACHKSPLTKPIHLYSGHDQRLKCSIDAHQKPCQCRLPSRCEQSWRLKSGVSFHQKAQYSSFPQVQTVQADFVDFIVPRSPIYWWFLFDASWPALTQVLM